MIEPSKIRWFHSVNLGGDHWSEGRKSRAVLEAEAALIFKGGVSQKTVLDIGAWDGFFSFEAERLGASRVLATDHFCWSGPGWGTKDGFDYAHAKRRSAVASMDIDLPDLCPKHLGTFDVVLFLGVLYHLKDPFGGLETAAKLTSDELIVETVTALNDPSEPVARYFFGNELNNDPTNYWAPNPKCLEMMLREVGFSKIEIVPHPAWRPGSTPGQPLTGRHIAFAHR